MGRASRLEGIKKQIITPSHTADMMGKDSPGVGNYSNYISAMDKFSKRRSGPSYNFSKSSRFEPSLEEKDFARRSPLLA